MEDHKLSQQVPAPESQVIEPQKNSNSGSKMKFLVAILVVVILGIVGFFAYKSLLPKQIVAKPKVIGIISYQKILDVVVGLKQGMAQLGYTAGKDIVYDEVKIIPGPNLDTDATNAVDKLMKDKVDVIVTFENDAKIALAETKAAGNNIPIVFLTRFHDPLNYGLIASYKSSGNNSTGVTISLTSTIQKNLSFFKEINPNAKKIGIFTTGFVIPNMSEQIIAEYKKQAPQFGFSIVEYTTQKPPDQTGGNWHEVADKIRPGEIDALVHLPAHFYDSETPGPGKSQEADEELLAERLHIPYESTLEDMPSGGTFSFNDDFVASAGQVAVMIQKILNGTKPKDIPIEYGAKSILTLNLKRAAAVGFQFPRSMISVANEIIK